MATTATAGTPSSPSSAITSRFVQNSTLSRTVAAPARGKRSPIPLAAAPLGQTVSLGTPKPRSDYQSLVTDLSAIHDALMLTELQAVQSAATNSKALTMVDWAGIVYPNLAATSLTKFQQNAVAAIADIFKATTFSAIADDASSLEQTLADLKSVDPFLNTNAVYRLFTSFANAVGSQSRAIVSGQPGSTVMENALDSAVQENPDLFVQLKLAGLDPTDIASIWARYDGKVDPAGTAEDGILRRIVSTYLGFGAPTAKATITVNAASNLGTIPDSAFGINTAVWDNGFQNPTVISLTKALKPDVLRFPGGVDSDLYNWQTNTLSNGGYVNPNDTFDNFMGFANNVGAKAMITVNYGTGTPTEAAGWVKYANVTHNYDVKYWEIGNEVYGNGYYNGNGWETDDHAVAGKPIMGNPGLSPQTYADNAAQYISQMKAVDPSIKIGAVLTMPYNWPWGATVNGNDNWNTTVLKTIGQDINFVDVHWYPETPGLETDAGLLADTNQIPAMVQELRKEIDQYAGWNAKNIQIFVTETNNTSSTPGQQSNNLVNALYLADDLAGFVQAGVQNVDWWDLLNSAGDGYNSPTLYGQNLFGDEGLLSSGQTSPKGAVEPPANTPLPTYYGYQMLADFAGPGDTLLGTLSNQPIIDSHAVKLPNGDLSVMLVNRDPSNTYDVSMNLEGYLPAPGATEEIYGEGSSSVTAKQVFGPGTDVKLPPYSATDILLHPISSGINTHQVTNQTTVSNDSISASHTQTITSTFTNNGFPLVGATLDLELYDSTGDLVAQDSIPNVTLGYQGSKQVTWNWSVPNITGGYTVAAYAFSRSGALVYLSDPGAASFTITPPTLTTYGDIVATNTTVSVAGSVYQGVYTIPDSNGNYNDGSTLNVAPGDTLTISTTFKNVSQSHYLQNAILDMEIDPGAFQYYTSSNNLAPGQSVTLSKTWTVPPTVASGDYQLGFQADNNNTWGGSNNCYYQPNVVTIAVHNSTPVLPQAKYGDIVTANTSVSVNGTVYNIPAPDSAGHYSGTTAITVSPGDAVVITTTFSNVSTSDYLQNGTLDIEVDGSSGAISKTGTTGVSLAPGEKKTVTATWNVGSSTASGAYTLMFEAFDGTWTGNCYYTNGGVAQFTVS